MSKNKKTIGEIKVTGMPKLDPMVRALDLIETCHDDFKLAYAESKAHAVARGKVDLLLQKSFKQNQRLVDMIMEADKCGYFTQELKDFAKGINERRTKKKEVRLDSNESVNREAAH